MSYVGKSNGPADAKVAEGPAGAVRILLGNPNTTSVTGTLWLKDTDDTFQLTKFTVDGSVCMRLDVDKPLEGHQMLYLTLDAAPTAQLTIWST